MKRIIITVLICWLLNETFAQPSARGDDTVEIRNCLEHYFNAGDNASSLELSKAFYQGAMMYWSHSNAEINHLTQRQWKTSLNQVTTPVKALKRNIQIIDIANDIGIAHIVSTYPDKIYYDYMALIKINNEWQIVSKVFDRQDNTNLKVTVNDPDEIYQIKSVIETKLKSMDTNDPDLLASAYYPRAMSFYNDENEMVPVSIGEWVARFDFDKKANKPIAKVKREIIQVHQSGSVGYVKFTHDFEKTLVTDLVLVIKSENRWKIINLLFTTKNK
jgi:protease I